ncbi:GNAT family N-acetyltransferase [Nocardiopsis ansamitocini]|uniref:N-acetyltransferase n=1 Tax=Nocardiopsis ansamitocini TaxID=1670832 RepID=A0A9W6UIP5_9ACTN|nr:GNAT family N-acetyltransferase [Nocardiopsis ansamitocini]GLU47912.1 N-acetyltransferase [Nocardiopsis ansamitocini]
MNELNIRRAAPRDLPAIVALLADDELGAARENPGELGPYREAFAAIDADSHQILAVAEQDGDVVGTLQLTFLPGLSHRGATRAQIEAVRVLSALRGKGLGSQLVTWAVGEARKRGCLMVQLTSNASRADAHTFYERLGFTPSHIGFKMALGQD